ncbi:MAG TPA: NAD-dependent epimerase/dehydratase family protein [Polyangiaceae bacterium]
MIAVTGATGFLGGAVVRALIERGEGVRAVVRSTSQVTELHRLGVETVEADVTGSAGLVEAFAGARLVVHAAGMLGRAGATETDYQRVHVDGTRNVLVAARAAGAERVVHVSSPGVLGPVPRGAPDLDEDAPVRPGNAYERSKAAAEDVVREDGERHGPLAVVVRPEFVYGPGDLHVLRLFGAVRRGRFFYIGPGDALCHPTFVDDAVRGLLAAAERGKAGRVYHVAGPRPVSIRELAGTYARAMGVRPPRLRVPEHPLRLALAAAQPLARRLRLPLPLTTSGVDFFTRDRHFSTRRAREELGFGSSVELPDGVARTVRWYEERGLL